MPLSYGVAFFFVLGTEKTEKHGDEQTPAAVGSLLYVRPLMRIPFSIEGIWATESQAKLKN